IDERSASAARGREAGSTRGSSRPFARRLHGFIAPSGWDADADASPRRPPPDPTAIRSSVLSTSSIPVAGGFNHLEHLAPNLLPWYGDRPATPKILTPSLRFHEPSHFDLVHGRTVADAVLEDDGKCGSLGIGEPHRGLENAFRFVGHQFSVARISFPADPVTPDSPPAAPATVHASAGWSSAAGSTTIAACR